MSALRFLLPLAGASQSDRRLQTMAVARAFGVALKHARFAAGLSQEELAHQAGFDRCYPSMLERGLRQPTLFTLLALSDALELSPEFLIEETRVRLYERIKKGPPLSNKPSSVAQDIDGVTR